MTTVERSRREPTGSVERSRREPNAFARELFTGLPDRYDRLGYLLSFGEDRRWRRAMIDPVAAARPQLVLDVATGPAGVALQLARRTGARIIGVDLTPEMLLRGRDNVARQGRGLQIQLALARGEQLPFRDATFDAVTFTYLLRYVADPAATVAELARVLRPGGVLSTLEFGVPDKSPWRELWRGQTTALLPAIGGLLGGPSWWRVGRFLGPSIAAHYAAHPIEEHVRWWQDAGIADVAVRRMTFGSGVVMWGRRA